MFPFEQLVVYSKAYETNRKLYRMLRGNNSIAGYAKLQLGKASLSIVLNIAEGSAKYSSKDRKNFFVVARGSAFECSSLLCLLCDEGEIPMDFKNELYSNLDEISRILYTMIKNLEK